MAKRRSFKKNKKQLKKLISLVISAVILVAALIGYLTGCFDSILANLGADGGDGREPTTVTGEMQIHFLDVGQGDCILVRSGEKCMLVDTGDKNDTYNEKIVDYLENLGITTINYLVLTHPDADHIGGAPDVINSFNVEKCIMPDFVKTTQIFEDTVDALDQRGVEVLNANELVSSDEGRIFTVGEAQCEILAPLKNDYDDVNDASVVIYLSFGETGVLLTGDAEAESEADIVSTYSAAVLKADVLKSGHHGSRTSSSEALLDMVDPDYAVISCGEDNKYGHPHSETVEKYEARDIEVYRTDISGTVVMITDGENIVFSVEK